MDEIHVESSNINTVQYDEGICVLTIKFHNGGTYQYYNVPLDIYKNLMAAESHGSYFHKYIKNNYETRKIN